MNKYIMFGLMLLGCNDARHSFPEELYIDPGFSNEEIEIIGESLDEWKRATGGVVNETMVIGLKHSYAHHEIMIKSSFDEKVKRFEKRNGVEIYGLHRESNWWGTLSPSDIWIVRDKVQRDSDDNEPYKRKFKRVIMHELGHHYGLEHDGDKDVLMSKFHKPIDCITQDDLKQFCDMYECGKDAAPTCEE